MKPTELRIGNYVQEYEDEPYYFKVEEIRKHVGFELWVVYRNGSIKTKEPLPIPLTEEWLVGFGFNSKYKSVHTHWNIRSFGIEQASDEDGEGNSIPQKQEFYYAFINEIKYVHQLQNLYFALTGEELTLTESK